MKITQDVRDYAQQKGIGDIEKAVETGLEEKASEFKTQGSVSRKSFARKTFAWKSVINKLRLNSTLSHLNDFTQRRFGAKLQD